MKRYLWIFIIVVVIIIAVLPKISGAEKMKEEIIQLPKPKLDGEVSVEAAINKRRSVRNYAKRELSLEQIGQLLWSAQGITDRFRGFRAAPSAGALYPLEIYITNKDGLFRYIPQGHKLEKISSKDLRDELADTSLGQSWVAQASVDIIICAVYERVTSRYGQRGIRYTDIEAGHAAQNVHLQAAALGLASVPVGAFRDDAASKILALPEDEKPIYIIPVGYKK